MQTIDSFMNEKWLMSESLNHPVNRYLISNIKIILFVLYVLNMFKAEAIYSVNSNVSTKCTKATNIICLHQVQIAIDAIHKKSKFKYYKVR